MTLSTIAGEPIQGLQLEQRAYEVWVDLPAGRFYGFGSTQRAAQEDLLAQLPHLFYDHPEPGELPLSAAHRLAQPLEG